MHISVLPHADKNVKWTKNGQKSRMEYEKFLRLRQYLAASPSTFAPSHRRLVHGFFLELI